MNDRDERKPYLWGVGDGATVRYVSDSYAYTVIEVNRNGKELVLQEDKAVKVGGEWPDYEYHTYPNPQGRIMTFTLRKNGVWRQKGSDMRHTGASLSPGRRYYQDPSF
jgi:hypothetical protein